jgi:predicted glycosyltransferase
LYGRENWTTKANAKTGITAAEMRFMRTTAKYIWSDYKINDDILKELKTEPIMKKVIKHKNSWIQYFNRMQRDRIPKLL